MFGGLVQLLIGFAILSMGGHYLVEGATRVALLARITPAVVGLTVVAMGTSMPELAVSLGAALRGATDISYANVVGSNIFNLGMILGVTLLVLPIAVGRQTFRLEYPFMMIFTCVMLLLSRDGLVDRTEGAFFLAALIAFLVFAVHLARRDVAAEEARELQREVERTARVKAKSTWAKSTGLVIVGIAGLAGGAELMVRGAVTLAETLGITERIIGLTVIAMGTSLPELATGVIAARRGESAIALGNIVGSNVFNILAILGITSLVVPVPVNPSAIALDNWVMLGFTVGLYGMMMVGRNLTRLDGIVLLVGFMAYMVYLFASI